MLQYDLTNTPLAMAAEPVRPPSEGELLAIVVGLLLTQQRTLTEIADAGAELVLDDAVRDRLTALLSEELKPLNRELGTDESFRGRLAQLVGMRIQVFR